MEPKRPTADRIRQQEWRAHVEEMRHLVENVSPQIFKDSAKARRADVPVEWAAMVASMRADVRASADRDELEEGVPVADRRGYHWSSKLSRVADMIEYLLAVVRADLEMEEGVETLASMVLLHKAFVELEIELQEGGSKNGREDRDEHRYRVLGALRSLTHQFDSPDLLRLRALVAGECAARFTQVPTDAEVEERLAAIQAEDPQTEEEREHSREFMCVTGPVMNGVMARSWLAEVDSKFATLDPLVVMEEFAEAEAKGQGGRSGAGDGIVGPARAVARLALMCGGLGAVQRNGEGFDEAVDRVRAALLTSRSRIRAVLRDFPGQVPTRADGRGDGALDEPRPVDNSGG
jgi:hypothetical protein